MDCWSGWIVDPCWLYVAVEWGRHYIPPQISDSRPRGGMALAQVPPPRCLSCYPAVRGCCSPGGEGSYFSASLAAAAASSLSFFISAKASFSICFSSALPVLFLD